MAKRTPGCVDAPKYDKDWCIFNPDKPETQEKGDGGCKPLNGCGSAAAMPYFYFFTLSVTFIMLNLFIGIILDAFGDETEEDDVLLNDANLDVFVQDWSKFDDPKKGREFLRVNQLKDFMQILDEPMGFGEDVVANDEDLEHRILNLGLDVAESNVDENDLGKSLVHIYHVATALAKRLTVMKQGDKFADVPKEHPTSQHLAAVIGGSNVAGGNIIKLYFLILKARRAGATVGNGFEGARSAAAMVADMPGNDGI